MLPAGTSLRLKLTILISIGVFIFGSVNLAVVGRLAHDALAAEQETGLRFTAALIAERAETPLLHDDLVELDRLVRHSVATNPRLAYVLIVDRTGRPVVHSFEREAPGWITDPLLVDAGRAEIVRFTAPDAKEFVDFVATIPDGRPESVRIGIDRSDAKASVLRLLSMLAGMVLVLLFFGLIAARSVATWMTSPAERIASALDDFRLGGPRVVIDVKTGDELERLAERVAAIMERIDRLHQNELERQRELARVERLAAVGTLTAGLAHELNNPLAGIKQAAENLAGRPGDVSRVRRYVPVILDAARRMERVLGDLLAFARPSGRELREVKPCDAVDLAARLAAPRLNEAGATLSVAHECAGRPVKADGDLLTQALLNLLLNAADAVSAAERRQIDISCRRDEPELTTILVSDSGPGIAEENRERVFEPFFTTKAPGKGTGLGLATAWTSVHQMGGILRLEPSERGACFALSLPEWKNDEDGPHPAR